MESANSRWTTHGIVKEASEVENDVSKALMAVSKVVAYATKRKFYIIWFEQKEASKRVSTQTEIESHSVILHIRAELE